MKRYESVELRKLQGAITSEDVLGKDVIDSGGVLLGVSDKLYLDPKTLNVLGISVDKGFLRKGFVISTEYIEEVASHAVFLNMQPATRMKGMIVFGRNGARIGKVTHVDLVQDTNKVSSIIVKTGFFSSVHVPARHIKSYDKNVFLSISKSELRDMKK